MKIVVLGQDDEFSTAAATIFGVPLLRTLDEVRDAAPFDYGISAWNNIILKEDIRALASRFWINTHPSFLPYGRGRDPYYWAIMKHETFGATLHVVDEGIDTGPIIIRNYIPVDATDTSYSLRQKARATLLDLLKMMKDVIMSGQTISYKPQPRDDYDRWPTRRREDMIRHRAAMRYRREFTWDFIRACKTTEAPVYLDQETVVDIKHI